MARLKFFKFKKLSFKRKETGKAKKIKKPKKALRIFSFLKNMKIAPKILLGFAVIAILGTGMGLYDSIALNGVSASSSQMYKEMLLPIRSINDISSEMLIETNAIRNLMVIEEDAYIEIYIAEIEQAQSTVNSTINNMEDLVTDPEATELLQTLKTSIATYNTLMNEAIERVRNGDQQTVIEDYTHVGELYTAEKTVINTIEKLSFAVTTKAGLLDTTNKNTAANVLEITLILIGVVIFCSLFIGIKTSRGLSRPIKKLTGALELLADGKTDIPSMDIASKNEVGQMAGAYESILASIKSLGTDTGLLIDAAAGGSLRVRADSGKHKGAYKKIIDGFNQTLDAITKPVNEAADALGEISNGNLDCEVSGEFKGDYAIIKNSLNKTINTLRELVSDTGLLAQAAEDGALSTRADETKHRGAYQKIVKGFNATLDAVLLPINEAVKILKEVSKGNLQVELAGDFTGDHAVIKDALNETISSLNRYIGEISYVLSEIAAGNFDTGITSEYPGDFVALKNSINLIIDSLSNMLLDIGTASGQMAAETLQLSQGSQAISEGAAKQAASIDELTGSVSQIAEQTRQNADNSGESGRMALEAKQAAAKCSDQMKEMLKSMEEINESSESISKIIKVIDDIAFQTNILALNAAVEAARAGSHGKGFAVVAEEVRSLAARSAEAARNTAELIEGSIKKVAAGTNIANDTAKGLSDIVERVDKTVDLGNRIAVSSKEQASGIQQVSAGIEQLSHVVQNNSSVAQEGAAASEEISKQAALLKKKTAVFKLKHEEEESGGPDTVDAEDQ
jgi:methyl-accepting chemotaxis protein